MTGNQLKSAFKKIGLTQDNASKLIGISRQTLNNWFKIGNLSDEAVQKVKVGLLKKYPTTEVLDILGVETEQQGNQSYGAYLLPIEAIGGSLSDYVASVSFEECERYNIPIRNVDWLIKISGDSMDPDYRSGDIVAIRKIDPNLFIQWGRVYVLDTANGSVIKELQPDNEDGYVQCISRNNCGRYKPFRVHLAEVFGIYLVLGIVRLE